MRLTVDTKILAVACGLLAAMAVIALVGIDALAAVSHKADDTFDFTTEPLAELGTARAKFNDGRVAVADHYPRPVSRSAPARPRGLD